MKLRRFLPLLVAFSLVFALAGCGGKSPADSSMAQDETTDPGYPVSIGEETIRQKPEKVVSLSPALTELCFDLGFSDQLCAVSDFCDYPTAVQSMKKAGTAQMPDLETIVSLKPDVVITHTQLSETDLIALQQADISVVVFSRARHGEDLKDLYVDLSKLFSGETTGTETGKGFYNEQMGRIESVKSAVDTYVRGGAKSLSAVYLRMLDFTVATGDTFEGEMLEQIGFENEAGTYGNWEYPADYLKDYAPDVIFCDETITIPMLEKNASYKGLQATIHDLVYSYDFTAFERQGTRMFDILEDMAKKGYPSAFGSGSGSTGSSSKTSAS